MSHSFIIPVYKDSIYLEECILSLIHQSQKSEVYITTSTPSDYIFKLAKKYKIEVLLNEYSTGIANDWNFALSKCKTKWLTLAHQDDIYTPDYFKTILEQVIDKNNVLIVFTDFNEIINNRIRSQSLNHFIKNLLLFHFRIKKYITSQFFKKFTLRFGNPICCPSVTYNVEKLKEFRFSKDYKFVLDWQAWKEISFLEGGFLFISKKLIHHRIHGQSATSAQMNTNNRIIEEEKILIDNLGYFFGKLWSIFYHLGHKENKF